jgi:hypothetical protein
MRRARGAAALPQLRIRVGRGESGYLRGLDGVDRYTSFASDSWHFDLEAGWSLDRLLFDREEIAASRETQRLGMRREQLVWQVTQLYFALARAQIELADADAADRDVRSLEVAELAAQLDGLTGGALTAPRGSSSSH